MLSNGRGEELTVNPEDFSRFRDFLQQACGIELGQNKQYLVATRIKKILRNHNLESLAQLIRQLDSSVNRSLRQEVIDVMTTNETFWFRDLHPYDYLKKTLLPQLSSELKYGKIRIWSAACSSGQEPYSISMIADEFVTSKGGLKPLPLEILATDLSSDIIKQAKEGVYDRLSVDRGLSDERLKRYFEQMDNDCWKVKQKIREPIQFKNINLQENFASLGPFHLVFCRNVLIYFSTELKRSILQKIHRVLVPGGGLFLGSSESLSGVDDLFEMVHCQPGIMYRAK